MVSSSDTIEALTNMATYRSFAPNSIDKTASSEEKQLGSHLRMYIEEKSPPLSNSDAKRYDNEISKFPDCFFEMLNCSFSGEIEDGLKMAEQSSRYLNKMENSVFGHVFYFHDALLRVRYVRIRYRLPLGVQRRHLKATQKAGRKLRAMERFGMMRAGHKWALIEAERARVKGNIDRAIQMYHTAINGAHASQLIHEEALFNELAGTFHLDIHHLVAGYAHLQRACELYCDWGVTAMANRLYNQYPHLPNSPARQAVLKSRMDTPFCECAAPEGDALKETTALLQAAQQFDAEMGLSSLIEQIRNLFRDIAQAERVLILLEQNGELTPAQRTTSTTDKDDWPAAIAYYVNRTGKSLVSNAGDCNFFIEKNIHLQNALPQPFFCLPLVTGTTSLGVVYFENLAFNQENRNASIRLLEIVAAQAASAIEKAKIKDALEKSEKELALLIAQKDEPQKILEDALTACSQLCTIDEHTADDLQTILNKLMVEQTVYRNSALSLETLAEITGYSARAVSEVINVRFKKNFYRYVNDFRIDDVKKRLCQPNESAGILEISLDAGFSSKSSFNLYFKQCTGMTPSMYRNRHTSKVCNYE
ncbi:MAG: helix-turn-helix domain-containing protein [Deltaproteobacteria bacterium]|nr:helix-turn-helix domain-containing protein [Deltaproteobacteria bacterium]